MLRQFTCAIRDIKSNGFTLGKWLVLWLMASILLPVAYGDTTIVDDTTKILPFAGNVKHWLDGENKASIASVLSGRYDESFTAWSETIIRPTTGQQWMRMVLRNNHSDESRWLLAVDTSYYHSIEVFYRDNQLIHVDQSDWQSFRAGNDTVFSEWPIAYRYPTLPIYLAPGNEIILYLRFNTLVSTPTLPYLITPKLFLARSHEDSFWTLLIIGIGFGMACYTLLLAATSNQFKGALIYAGMMIAGTILLLSFKGFFQRWSPDDSSYQAPLMIFSSLITRVLLVLFARDIFHTRVDYPRIDRCCLGFVWFAPVLPFLWFFVSPLAAAYTYQIYSLCLLLFLVPVSIYWLWNRKNLALLFFVGLIGYMGLLLLRLLSNMDWVPQHWVPNNTMTLAYVCQSLTFALLLAYRLSDFRVKNMQLKTERAVAQAENSAKSELLATMSHEIRTPINGVLGMAELLQGTELNSTQRHYTQTIQSSGNTLLTVIDDILDYSKSEAKKLTLKNKFFDVAVLLDEIVAPFHVGLDDKIQLIVSIEPKMPTRLYGDPVRIRQVISNLLSNAIKFTETGRVECYINVKVLEEKRVQLHCQISDTGIGIADQDIQRLFKPFSQIDSSSERRFGGTGLGLAICQQLVSLMKGDIRVSSVLGQGSQFSFDIWLPFDDSPVNVDAVKAINTVLPQYDQLNVLVAEDNAVNRQVIEALLLRFGIHADIVHNGQEALARAIGSNNHYDLILMDCEMPIMDGYHATERIRQYENEHHCQPVWIVALSAHAMAEHRERSLKIGMNEHLSKPINLSVLSDLMQRVAKKSS